MTHAASSTRPRLRFRPLHRLRLVGRLCLAGPFLALALPAASCAQLAGAPATHDPARVQSGAYRIDPLHTQVLFSVSHLGFSTYYGEFSQASGRLDLDVEAPSRSAVEIRVPVDSVTTTSDKLTRELKGSDWLDAGADPEMVFKSTKVTPLEGGAAMIAGDLTLHGVTRPVLLRATLVGAGINPLDHAYTVGFNLVGTIRRSDFGVRTYVPLVGDLVTLTIASAFEKRGPEKDATK